MQPLIELGFICSRCFKTSDPEDFYKSSCKHSICHFCRNKITKESDFCIVCFFTLDNDINYDSFDENNQSERLDQKYFFDFNLVKSCLIENLKEYIWSKMKRKGEYIIFENP